MLHGIPRPACNSYVIGRGEEVGEQLVINCESMHPAAHAQPSRFLSLRSRAPLWT
jgi:hypothetical protein